MADKEYYIGTVGPLIYNDTDQYEDGIDMQGLRSPQVVLDEAPTEDYHAARKDYVDGLVVDPATTVVSETSFGQSPAVGGMTTFAREDHTHGTPTAPTSTSRWWPGEGWWPYANGRWWP